MSPRGSRLNRAGRLTCALLCFALPRAAETTGREEPLDNEAIVRLVMAGATQGAILARLERSAVDFDLSPETVEELRLAGVPAPILEAMRRRQAEMPKPEPATTPPPAETGELILRVVPDPEAATAPERSILAVRALPPRAHRPGGMEVNEAADLALAILCTTPDHVPDHWESRTRLLDAPRHELLYFKPGSSESKLKGFEVLYLKLDPTIDLTLPAGAHRLLVAAAAQQTGSRAWRILASAEARVTVVPGATTRLALKTGSRLRGNAMRGFDVTLAWEVAAAEPAPLEGPSPAATPVSVAP